MRNYILMILLSMPLAHADLTQWTHFTICNPLPGEDWGAAGPALGDFDRDGDLDIALSRRTTETAYWYERISDEKWVQHTMGGSDALKEALGNAVLDLNGDGLLDVVISSAWFENPGVLGKNPDAPWPVHSYAGKGHDIVAVDINADSKQDLVADLGHNWFDAAKNLEAVPIFEGMEYHGGVAPQGVGDLDGDGDIDIVVPGRWYANSGAGRGEWVRHDWPYKGVPDASYGPSMRSWIVDLNHDGWNDIVYSDCDTGMSHVYWVENGGKGETWTRRQLQDPPTAKGDVEGTGSFHSLAVADFDGDGDLDIFAGEQEDADTYMEKSGKIAMRPRGLKERGCFWENIGDAKSPKFQTIVIHTDNPGWHDVAIGDVDGDGDLDIVSKIWHSDGGPYHADYWRNDNPQGK